MSAHIEPVNVLRIRKDFSKIPPILEIPNLIEIQKQTFDRFLQIDVEQEKRENVGLQAVFNSVFPIKDFNDSASLEFVGYTLEEPKYDVQECLQRGMTYAAPFKVTIRLVAWDDTEGSQAIRDVKEQEVYFGEIPIMTENGTFIINGTERVIVSQLHRSPGIFFDTSTSSTVTAAGKRIYSCRIIPYRGSWLDLEFDHKDLLYARIDRRRKIHGTVLLKARFANDDEAFWPGQFLTVRMRLGVDRDALVVPATAVVPGQEGNYVFVLKADSTVAMRSVAVGRTTGQDAVLTDGVSPGELVVTDGQIRLRDGARVAVSGDGARTTLGADGPPGEAGK